MNFVHFFLFLFVLYIYISVYFIQWIKFSSTSVIIYTCISLRFIFFFSLCRHLYSWLVKSLSCRRTRLNFELNSTRRKEDNAIVRRCVCSLILSLSLALVRKGILPSFTQVWRQKIDSFSLVYGCLFFFAVNRTLERKRRAANFISFPAFLVHITEEREEEEKSRAFLSFFLTSFSFFLHQSYEIKRGSVDHR
jgi:hypothetical protein